jgi:hypothetical protein
MTATADRAMTFNELVLSMRAQGVPLARAEAFARAQLGIVAAPTHEGPTAAEEKAVEHAGDKLMIAHGFRAIRFSQPRVTKQTPGISDRLYIHPTRRLAVWWEAKTVFGKQSSAQKDFQALVECVGWTYLVGTDAVLTTYLADHFQSPER